PLAYVEQSVTTNAFNDYQPFAFPFPSFNHTFPYAGRIRLTVRNTAASPSDALLAMNATFAGSVVELDTTTYVRSEQIDIRDAVERPRRGPLFLRPLVQQHRLRSGRPPVDQR